MLTKTSLAGVRSSLGAAEKQTEAGKLSDCHRPVRSATPGEGGREGGRERERERERGGRRGREGREREGEGEDYRNYSTSCNTPGEW